MNNNTVELIGYYNSGIYLITSPSGKKYIGCSKNIEKRFYNYKYACNIKAQVLLYKSFLKYGPSSHTFEIIEYLPPDNKILGEREIYWIKTLNTERNKNTKGLNLTPGGNIPNKQTKPKTEEQKKKISESNSGKVVSEETKNKIRKKLTGLKQTEETKEKIRQKAIGRLSKLKGTKRPIISQKLKGKQTAVSIKCIFIDTEEKVVVYADSIIKLSKIVNIPSWTLGKIYNNKPTKYKNRYEFQK